LSTLPAGRDNVGIKADEHYDQGHVS